MSLDDEVCEARRLFMPIAVIEHHQMFNPKLNVYDICEQLGVLWKQVQMETEAKIKFFNLEVENILALNARVAMALGGEPINPALK